MNKRIVSAIIIAMFVFTQIVPAYATQNLREGQAAGDGASGKAVGEMKLAMLVGNPYAAAVGAAVGNVVAASTGTVAEVVVTKLSDDLRGEVTGVLEEAQKLPLIQLDKSLDLKVYASLVDVEAPVGKVAEKLAIFLDVLNFNEPIAVKYGLEDTVHLYDAAIHKVTAVLTKVRQIAPAAATGEGDDLSVQFAAAQKTLASAQQDLIDLAWPIDGKLERQRREARVASAQAAVDSITAKLGGQSPAAAAGAVMSAENQEHLVKALKEAHAFSVRRSANSPIANIHIARTSLGRCSYSCERTASNEPEPIVLKKDMDPAQDFVDWMGKAGLKEISFSEGLISSESMVGLNSAMAHLDTIAMFLKSQLVQNHANRSKNYRDESLGIVFGITRTATQAGDMVMTAMYVSTFKERGIHKAYESVDLAALEAQLSLGLESMASAVGVNVQALIDMRRFYKIVPSDIYSLWINRDGSIDYFNSSGRRYKYLSTQQQLGPLFDTLFKETELTSVRIDGRLLGLRSLSKLQNFEDALVGLSAAAANKKPKDTDTIYINPDVKIDVVFLRGDRLFSVYFMSTAPAPASAPANGNSTRIDSQFIDMLKMSIKRDSCIDFLENLTQRYPEYVELAKEQVLKCIAEATASQPGNWALDTNLEAGPENMNIPGFDSLSGIELEMAIEEKLGLSDVGVEIAPGGVWPFKELRTVGHLVLWAAAAKIVTDEDNTLGSWNNIVNNIFPSNSAPAAATGNKLAITPERVLVVEGDDVHRKVAGWMLKNLNVGKENITIIPTVEGIESALGQINPDLIILDIYSDGVIVGAESKAIALIERLRAQGLLAPVILTSTANFSTPRDELASLGISTLEKPFNTDALREKIDEAMTLSVGKATGVSTAAAAGSPSAAIGTLIRTASHYSRTGLLVANLISYVENLLHQDIITGFTCDNEKVSVSLKELQSLALQLAAPVPGSHGVYSKLDVSVNDKVAVITRAAATGETEFYPITPNIKLSVFSHVRENKEFSKVYLVTGVFGNFVEISPVMVDNKRRIPRSELNGWLYASSVFITREPIFFNTKDNGSAGAAGAVNGSAVGIIQQNFRQWIEVTVDEAHKEILKYYHYRPDVTPYGAADRVYSDIDVPVYVRFPDGESLHINTENIYEIWEKLWKASSAKGVALRWRDDCVVARILNESVVAYYPGFVVSPAPAVIVSTAAAAGRTAQEMASELEEIKVEAKRKGAAIEGVRFIGQLHTYPLDEVIETMKQRAKSDKGQIYYDYIGRNPLRSLVLGETNIEIAISTFPAGAAGDIAALQAAVEAVSAQGGEAAYNAWKLSGQGMDEYLSANYGNDSVTQKVYAEYFTAKENLESAKAAAAGIDTITRNFTLPVEGMQSIVKRFHSEMENGLAGKPGSLKMLPAHVDVTTGKETGRYLALDLGGTNFRVLQLELKGDSRMSEPAVRKFELTEDLIKGTGEQLFNFIAGCIAAFLNEQGILASQQNNLGFTFSFPINQTAIAQGSLVVWTKDFTASGVEGQDVVRLLKEALSRKAITNVAVDALCNDTVGTLQARAYEDPTCDVGVILGTGTNGCYREDLANITKLHSATAGHMIVNMEWGNFNGLTQTPYDVQLDRTSGNPGQQVLEKMVSGKYLGELTRLIIADLILKKAIFEGQGGLGFSAPDSFETVDMSAIELNNSSDLEVVNKILTRFGVVNSSIRDRMAVKQICSAVSGRAARISAAVIAATVMKMDPDLSRRHTVAVDGTLYEKYTSFAQRIEAGLMELLGEKTSQIKTVYTTDGSGKGAAVIAAVASAKAAAAGDIAVLQAKVEATSAQGGEEAYKAWKSSGQEMKAYLDAQYGNDSGMRKLYEEYFIAKEELARGIASAKVADIILTPYYENRGARINPDALAASGHGFNWAVGANSLKAKAAKVNVLVLDTNRNAGGFTRVFLSRKTGFSDTNIDVVTLKQDLTEEEVRGLRAQYSHYDLIVYRNAENGQYSLVAGNDVKLFPASSINDETLKGAIEVWLSV